MTESGDDRLRSAWAKQTDQDADWANAGADVGRQRAAIARRDRTLYLSALVIGPSWAAAIWLFPDLWLASVPGLFIAIWLTWQMYRRSGARLLGAPADLPCLAFQRTLLERELDLARSLPKWYLVPLAVGQVAITATMATNPRFTSTQFYPEGVVLFVATAGVALVVVWRRAQRRTSELQRELEVIDAATAPTAATRSLKD